MATHGTDVDGTPWHRRHRVSITWLALLSVGAVPWVVIRTSGTTLLFPWGTVLLETGNATPITAFFSQPGPTPAYFQYWPLGGLCYALALVWAGARQVGLEADQRVTAGLLALVGLVALLLADGFGVDPNRTALPLATVYALSVAAWVWFVGLE